MARRVTRCLRAAGNAAITSVNFLAILKPLSHSNARRNAYPQSTATAYKTGVGPHRPCPLPLTKRLAAWDRMQRPHAKPRHSTKNAIPSCWRASNHSKYLLSGDPNAAQTLPTNWHGPATHLANLPRAPKTRHQTRCETKRSKPFYMPLKLYSILTLDALSQHPCEVWAWRCRG